MWRGVRYATRIGRTARRLEASTPTADTRGMTRPITITIAIALTYTATAYNIATAHAKPVRCTEDMRCWTWPTMGNSQRSVLTTHGPKTVTCRGLRWLVRHGDLDPRTPHLRGDRACGRR
jgi:hypothetical protein